MDQLCVCVHFFSLLWFYFESMCYGSDEWSGLFSHSLLLCLLFSDHQNDTVCGTSKKSKISKILLSFGFDVLFLFLNIADWLWISWKWAVQFIMQLLLFDIHNDLRSFAEWDFTFSPFSVCRYVCLSGWLVGWLVVCSFFASFYTFWSFSQWVNDCA